MIGKEKLSIQIASAILMLSLFLFGGFNISGFNLNNWNKSMVDYYNFKADKSDIHILHQDLSDIHNSLMDNSSHKTKNENAEEYIVVEDSTGNVVSVIKIK